MNQLTVKGVYNGDTRRFSISDSTSFIELHQLIQKLYNITGDDWTLKYTDDEGDWIQLSSDLELEEAKRVATKNSLLRVQIFKKADPAMSDAGSFQEQVASPSASEHVPLQGRVHFGFSCDGCNLDPIVGIRYKCDDCKNYDLCSICFSAHNKHTPTHSFSALELPERYEQYPNRNYYNDFQANDDANSFEDYEPQSSQSSQTKQTIYSVKFLENSTIADGTEMAPNTNFTKIWRFKNEGTFPKGSQLRLIDGDGMNGPVLGINVATIQTKSRI